MFGEEAELPGSVFGGHRLEGWAAAVFSGRSWSGDPSLRPWFAPGALAQSKNNKNERSADRVGDLI